MNDNDTDHIVIRSHEGLWATKELARFLGCSERHVMRLRQEGLPTIRIGAMVRYVPERVMAWLDWRGGRATQLGDVVATGNEDNAQCAEADLFREFPPE